MREVGVMMRGCMVAVNRHWTLFIQAKLDMVNSRNQCWANLTSLAVEESIFIAIDDESLVTPFTTSPRYW